MAGSYNLSHRLVNSWYASFLTGILLAKVFLPRIEKLYTRKKQISKYKAYIDTKIFYFYN